MFPFRYVISNLSPYQIGQEEDTCMAYEEEDTCMATFPPTRLVK